jgi:hypothetical protein
MRDFWARYLEKLRCGAGFDILPCRIARCHYRTEILCFRGLPFPMLERLGQDLRRFHNAAPCGFFQGDRTVGWLSERHADRPITRV